MGIPEEYSIGVSTAVVRAIVKKAGKSNELARELWNSGYHEAKLLAVLVFDKKRTAFVLIASSVIHNKAITNDTLDAMTEARRISCDPDVKGYNK